MRWAIASSSRRRLRLSHSRALKSSRPRATKSGQRRPQQRIEAGLLQGWLAPQPVEYGTDLPLAKAEVAQRGEDPGSSLDGLRLHAVAVLAAVRMAGADSAVFAPIENDLAAMGGAVMRIADANEVFHRVTPTFGAELEMMHIQKARVLTARNLAAALIA